jgi:protein-arginine kinase activator protein McsA
MKCDICGKRADVHLTEIKYGKKTERHLCHSCAASVTGVPIDAGIKELLSRFVEQHFEPPEAPPK